MTDIELLKRIGKKKKLIKELGIKALNKNQELQKEEERRLKSIDKINKLSIDIHKIKQKIKTAYLELDNYNIEYEKQKNVSTKN